MKDLKKILENLKNGKLSVDDVLFKLKDIPFENLGFAHIDHHRFIRQGFPEVIYCPGKTNDQIIKITQSILDKDLPLLATRAEPSVFESLNKKFSNLNYNKLGRVVYSKALKNYDEYENSIVIVTAGTSDIAIAEEAYQTALMVGFKAKKIFDVGVAGIHRLFKYTEEIREAKVIIVIAGMEGALASVVGGLVSIPVIAVPTSTGYGASFNGLAALLSMLNSCASGITVVNIDNGFGAAFAACKILKLLKSD